MKELKNYKKSDTDFTDFFTIPDEDQKKAGPLAEQIRDESRTQSPGEPGPTQKKKPAHVTGHTAPAILAADPEPANIPTSPGLYICTEAMIYAGQFPQLAERMKNSSKAVSVHFLEEETGGHQIAIKKRTGKNAGYTINVKLEHPEIIAREGTNVLKLFLYAFNLINRQIAHSGEITQDHIFINVKDLVRNGIYNSEAYARKALVNAADALSSIKIRGEIYRGKKKIEQVIVTVFPTVHNKIENGSMKLRVNPDLNYEFFAVGYTKFPVSLYKLKGRPLELAYQIMYIARTKCGDIRQKGGFNISIEAVQKYLNLPDLQKTKDPRGKIINAIETAAREIEKTVPEIDIDVCNIGDGSPKEYLKGNLNIIFSGSLLEYFSNLADVKTKKIEDRMKREEQRLEKAKMQNLAKKLAKEEQARGESSDEDPKGSQ